MEDLNQLTEKIIGCGIEVHRHLGPGLLEATYEEALCIELTESGMKYGRQVPFPILYEGRTLGQYRLDLLVEDAVIAQSGKEVQEFWAVRDCPGEYRRVFWPQVTFDVSLPTGELGDFVTECRSELEARWPGIRSLFFGHVADGNIHLSAKPDEEPLPEPEIEEIVYRTIGKRSGSISAEHGIGTKKIDFLHYSRTPEEIALMRTLKSALDPKSILNPGKVLGRT